MCNCRQALVVLYQFPHYSPRQSWYTACLNTEGGHWDYVYVVDAENTPSTCNEFWMSGHILSWKTVTICCSTPSLRSIRKNCEYLSLGSNRLIVSYRLWLSWTESTSPLSCRHQLVSKLVPHPTTESWLPPAGELKPRKILQEVHRRDARSSSWTSRRNKSLQSGQAIVQGSNPFLGKDWRGGGSVVLRLSQVAGAQSRALEPDVWMKNPSQII